jgi:hypothetical protein
LEEALNADSKMSSIRLREGEHQHALVRAIASFQLEMYFPDVKDIVKKLYGEEKTDDIQLIRKIQTILKKMEKSNTIRILPKKKPWELQRYALPSYKFQDAEKNLVILATDEQVKQAQNLLHSELSQQETVMAKPGNVKTKVYTSMLAFIIVASYIISVWDIMQPIISPLIFVSAFSVAVTGSVILGKILSKL